MRRILKLSIITLFFSSCIGDPITSTSVQLHNNSSYDIFLLTEVFSGNNVDYCVKYELPKGETLTLTTANETNYGYVFPVWQDEQIVSLQFGEAVSIPTRKTKLLDNYAYEILKDDKKGKKYTLLFGYTFTDADYQFALKHGTPIE